MPIADNITTGGQSSRTNLADLLERIKNVPNTPGVRFLEKYWRGEELHLSQMILAKCADCTCYYVDGREDCGMEDCPLHPRMPYRNHKPPRYIRPDRRPDEVAPETPIGEALDGGDIAEVDQ
jgi:hypothetical protein